MESKKYIMSGNTYKHRNGLKNFGAKWNPEKKQWEAVLVECQISNFDLYFATEFEMTEKDGVAYVVFN